MAARFRVLDGEEVSPAALSALLMTPPLLSSQQNEGSSLIGQTSNDTASETFNDDSTDDMIENDDAVGDDGADGSTGDDGGVGDDGTPGNLVSGDDPVENGELGNDDQTDDGFPVVPSDEPVPSNSTDDALLPEDGANPVDPAGDDGGNPPTDDAVDGGNSTGSDDSVGATDDAVNDDQTDDGTDDDQGSDGGHDNENNDDSQGSQSNDDAGQWNPIPTPIRPHSRPPVVPPTRAPIFYPLPTKAPVRPFDPRPPLPPKHVTPSPGFSDEQIGAIFFLFIFAALVSCCCCCWPRAKAQDSLSRGEYRAIANRFEADAFTDDYSAGSDDDDDFYGKIEMSVVDSENDGLSLEEMNG